MKWYSYSYSEAKTVSSTSTSTAQAEYEYDNAVIPGFGQHLVVAISEKCQILGEFRYGEIVILATFEVNQGCSEWLPWYQLPI